MNVKAATDKLDEDKIAKKKLRRINENKKYRLLHKERVARIAKESYAKTRRERPWEIVYRDILKRCTNKSNSAFYHYGARGIKCLITKEQVKYLWNRDNAASLKKPSIDRVDSDLSYTLDNCRFIEKDENCRLASAKRWRDYDASRAGR
jgi:hypothetical protein